MSITSKVIPPSIYIPINEVNCLALLTDTLSNYFSRLLPHHEHQLVILCIGTDRATGDSLGPLVGYKLYDLNLQHVTLFGTLDMPVHAKNLEVILEDIGLNYPNALILAVDACLGTMDKVGNIKVGEGSIRPGTGVKKDLPSVGHFHLTGIVNFSSMMNMVVLQNTRLATVMKMADLIASSLRHALLQYYSTNECIT